KRHAAGPESHASPNHGEQAECRKELTEYLGASSASVVGQKEQGQSEHPVRRAYSGEGSQNLGRDVAWNLAPWETALRGISQRDGRVEVGSGNCAEGQD